MMGQYKEALEIFNIELDHANKGEISLLGRHINLADVYSELGEHKKARNHVDEALKLDANYSLKSVRRHLNHFKDPNHLELIINSLRKAGLPDHS